MKTAQLPEPRFRQIEAMAHQVHATLENDITARKSFAGREVFRYIAEADFAGLTEDEKAVINFLVKNREINVTAASLATGRSWPTAAKILSSLVDQGHIEQMTKRGRKHDSTKSYKFRSDVLDKEG